MADSDFPLIKAYQLKGVDVTVLIEMDPRSVKTTLFNIKKQVHKTTIFPSITYTELKFYEQYMDMSKIYILNRTSSRKLSWSYYKSSWLIHRFIMKGRFNVVHATGFVGVERVILYRMIKPWITTVHDPIPHSGGGNREKKDANRVKMLEWSDGIVLLNENQKMAFCNKYNVKPNKVLINHLGVYDWMKLFVPKDAKQDPYNILFFGRIQTYKGLEYLCEAMQIVRKEIPQATLTIAGSGKIYFNINPYLRQGFIKLYNRYIAVEELAAFLYNCALCVCPYTDATQSGVIMTAFALGVPVVASDVGGLGEMVEDGKNGFLVPPKNINALANAIIGLLRNQTLIIQLSANIIEENNNGKRSWSNIANSYLNYYQYLINEKNR